MVKLFLAVAICLLSPLTYAAAYGGGKGTPGEPYEIRTPEQMNTLGANSVDWDKHFRLTANINMSAYTGTQYNIIGNSSTPFSGTFDGGGHVISNLTYTTTASVHYVGLFGRTSGAAIRNLGVENVSLTSGGNYVGGLVGYNASGTITACYASGSVSGGFWVGGLVGDNAYGLLTACHTSGSVRFRAYGGGLAGNNYGTLTACHTSGSVSSGVWCGGLVGNNYGPLTACYATGSVGGTDYVGGLVGRNYGDYATLTDCYATGSVSLSGTGGYIGGLAGWNNGALTACFWDILSSGRSHGVGDGVSGGVMGKTTLQMMTRSTFTDAGWDFTNELLNGTHDTWRMCTEGVDYPRLNRESSVGDFACPDGVNIEDLNYYVGWWLMTNCAQIGRAHV